MRDIDYDSTQLADDELLAYMQERREEAERDAEKERLRWRDARNFSWARFG